MITIGHMFDGLKILSLKMVMYFLSKAFSILKLWKLGDNMRKGGGEWSLLVVFHPPKMWRNI